MYIEINYFFLLKMSTDHYPCLLLQQSTIEFLPWSVPKDDLSNLNNDWLNIL